MEEATKERLFKVISQIIKVPIGQINEASSAETIERWDSLSHINLILALEEEFDVKFSSEQIVGMFNVRLILNTLENLGVR